MKLFFAGGLNEQQTPSLFECGQGYNFELGLRQSKLVRRKPLDLKGTATNSSSINGLMQLVKRDNTETTLVQAGVRVYRWDGGYSGNYLNLPGAAGDYATTPDSAALDIVGSIQIIGYIAPDSVTPATVEYIANKFTIAGDQRAYRISLTTTGSLLLQRSTDGMAGTVTAQPSTVPVPFVSGQGFWLKATYNSATGEYNYYTSSDPATTSPASVSFTALGSTVVGASGAIFASTSQLAIGQQTDGTLGTFNGKIYRVLIYDGIGGTLVSDFNVSDTTTGSTSWTSIATGETWTVNGAASTTTSFGTVGTVSASSKLRDTYWSLGDYLIITDLEKQSVVKKWTGSALSNLTTGLGTDLYAKYGVVFNNRVWLFNVKTSSDTPHLMVASAFENPQSYDTSLRGGPTTSGGGSFATGQEAFYMLSPDLKPINGAVVFYNQLIISTEGGRLFKLTGSTAATYTWTDFYPGSAAIGDESMANIGNDVIYMKAGGGIDLLSTTQNAGDVAADDVSRWIPTTTADLTDAITIYDQKNQRVLFFVSGKVLVLYKDLLGGELSPWSVYKTQEDFAFNTNAAKYMKRPGTQTYSVYFGDDVGRIFDLYGSGPSGDAGSSSIQVFRKTRYIYDGEGGDKNGRGAIDTKRKMMHGLVQYRRVSTGCDVTVSFDWGDEYNESSSVIALKGAPSGTLGNYYGGGAYWGDPDTYWNEGGAFLNKISNQTFSPTGKGPGFFLSVSLDTNTEFQIDNLELQPPAR